MRSEDFWKAVATISIWVICGAIAITTVLASNSNYTWEMTGIPFIAAIFPTFVMWAVPYLVNSDIEKARIEKQFSSGNVNNDDDKLKNQRRSVSNRTSLLLELMDEDEREEFKRMLKRRVLQERRLTDDGELFADSETLEALMDAPDNDYHQQQ